MPRPSMWSLTLRVYNKNTEGIICFVPYGTHPTYLILLDFITVTLVHENLNLWSSWVCDSPHSPVHLSVSHRSKYYSHTVLNVSSSLRKKYPV